MTNTKQVVIVGSGQAPLPRITEDMIKQSQIQPLDLVQSYPTIQQTIQQTKQKTRKKLNKRHMLNK